jgi:ubiquinone/menaquinone biosynthesis C-methylase UbiE
MTQAEVSHERWTSPDKRVAAKWIDERDRTDRMLLPFGQRVLDIAALVPGERVLDIGCGSGATTLAAWQRVAPDGNVTGVDISPVMLDLARTRVRDVAAPSVAWLEADVETYPFPGDRADVAISRFALGHFSNTVPRS